MESFSYFWEKNSPLKTSFLFWNPGGKVILEVAEFFGYKACHFFSSKKWWFSQRSSTKIGAHLPITLIFTFEGILNIGNSHRFPIFKPLFSINSLNLNFWPLKVWDISLESATPLYRAGGGVTLTAWSPDERNVFAATPSSLFRWDFVMVLRWCSS